MRDLSRDRLAGMAHRFWAAVAKGEADDCWPWTGTKRPDGYGVIGYRREGMYRAHRVALAMVAGDRPDRIVLHSCDNPSCVNPRHLSWGTHQDNHDDAALRGRNRLGEANGSSKLGRVEVLSVMADRRLLREIAEDYGVSIGTISDIKNGRTWSWLRSEHTSAEQPQPNPPVSS